MNTAEDFIKARLQQRAAAGNLRSLSQQSLPIDFCSNDYLGFARSPELKARTAELLAQVSKHPNGATGSRLLSGNHWFTEETEAAIASFHQAEAGLIFNSGYDANLGLVSAIAQAGDTLISDELIHASLIDAARLSQATRYTFKHNDLEALESKLKLATGLIYVLVESVYSMDGDLAPLSEIQVLCRKYQANLIVDEAHALGVIGKHGKGLVNQLGLEQEVFARVMTFGKALGCHGAIVLGSTALRQYLINFSRSFIYTTAAPAAAIASIRCGYELLNETDYQLKIAAVISNYENAIVQLPIEVQLNPSPIQIIPYQDSKTAKQAAVHLQSKGLDVRAILIPTVRKGTERLRICLHTYNTSEEISQLVKEILACARMT